MLNSLLIASVTTAFGVLFMAATAAYAFSRFRFRGRRSLQETVPRSIQVFPRPFEHGGPVFDLYNSWASTIPQLGLNTYGGLILLYLGGMPGSPPGRGQRLFFDPIHARPGRGLRRSTGPAAGRRSGSVVLPLVRPISAVIGLLC
jgi:arabinogalactan oligomer/maltooligosaccharide transport system permease protein